MTYTRAKQRSSEVAEPGLPVNHRCPAYGCPNSASTSFDGARWACYEHAKAPAAEWPAVTQELLARWPASCNWGHPDKLAYERTKADQRRASRPVVGPRMRDMGALPAPDEASSGEW